jgi:hypothetical protein
MNSTPIARAKRAEIDKWICTTKEEIINQCQLDERKKLWQIPRIQTK